MSITLYGIKNCDTVKKARKWLDQHQVNYVFVDHRADGLNPDSLHHWLDTLGWEQLVNKRSTTYRALSESEKANLGPNTAYALLEANPTLIKRPLLDNQGQLSVGFKAEQYAALFKQ